MSHMACPTCIANASIEAAWSLLDPAHLDEWWDARTRCVTPQGPLSPGQRIEAIADEEPELIWLDVPEDQYYGQPQNMEPER